MKRYITLLMACAVLGASNVSFAADNTRGQNLQIVEDFLTQPDIEQAMTHKHGKDVTKLMKKVNKLSDRKLAKLAKNTEELMQYGAESGTQHVESKTAETISGQWLKLGYAALAVPIILLLLILL